MIQFIYIFGLISILAASSCSRSIGDNKPMLPHEEQNRDSLTEVISMEELPIPIKEGISKEEVFKGLNISNIVKITENDYTYYDMTFRDVDGQLIMVFYDKEGKIIVP